MRNTFVSLTLILVGLAVATSSVQGDVYLEVEVPEYGYIPANTPVTFVVKMDADVGENVTSVQNCLRVYSPQGAVWQTPTVTVGADMATYFDGAVSLVIRGVDGSNDDTIGVLALAVLEPGVPDGYEGLELFRINTEVSDTEIGDTICIDSSFFYPAGTWRWTTPTQSVMPGWGGPYCWGIVEAYTCYANGDANNDGLGLTIGDLVYLHAFIHSDGPEPTPLYSCNLNGDDFVNAADLQLYEDYFAFGLSVFGPYGGYPVPGPCDPTPQPSCCIGIRGNIDGDLAENIDISDLVFQVDWMFAAGDPPPCPEEADLNGDEVIDIGDLVYSVDFMFVGGPPPVACDER